MPRGRVDSMQLPGMQRGRVRTDSFNLPSQAMAFIDSIPGQEKYRKGNNRLGNLNEGKRSRTESRGSMSAGLLARRPPMGMSMQIMGGTGQSPTGGGFAEEDENNSRTGRSSVSSMSGRRSSRGPRDTAGGGGRMRRPSTTGDAPRGNRLSMSSMRNQRRQTGGATALGRQRKKSGGRFGRKSVIQQNTAALPVAPQRNRNKNNNRNNHKKADNLEKMHVVFDVTDPKAKVKRHWEASLTNDLSFFMYPSLVVGSMKKESPMWSLREEKMTEEESMNDPAMKVTKASAHPILDDKMIEGEEYLRKKMRDTMYQRELEKRQKELKEGENRQKNLLAAALGSGHDDKDHDYNVEVAEEPDHQNDDGEEAKSNEEEEAEEKREKNKLSNRRGKLFKASILRRASAVPKSSVMVLGSKKKTAKAQSQSVEAYTSIMKRGGKLRRAIRSVEKLNTKAHDKRAILERVEKFIPTNLRDTKVAIMSYALSKQLKDQAANIFLTNLEPENGDKYDSHPNSSMRTMPRLEEEDDKEDPTEAGLEKKGIENFGNVDNHHHGFQHYFYVGMGEAGHMGEFSEGQVDLHNKHEFIGESARQSFFDRFQRIAINQYDEGASPSKAVERLNEDHRGSPSSKNIMAMAGALSRTRLFSMGMESTADLELEEENGEVEKEDPLAKLHPMDKYLATCIERNIAPEPLLVKKSYFSGESFDEWAKETKEAEEGTHTYKEDFFKKLKSNLKFKHSVDNLIYKNFGIGDEKARALAGALANMPFIRLVDVSYNRLTDKSLPNFLDSLVNHKTLMNLNLSGNAINSVVAETIRDFMKGTTALRVLIMENCGITDKELDIFSTGFLDNSVVTNLGLSRNKIRSRGGEIFGDLFEKNCSLEMLDLGHNMISGSGAVAFGRGLKDNTRLKVINLEVNRMGCEGTMAIGQSLNTNKTLEELNLEYNGVEMKGCFVMAAVLRKNTSLKKMSLLGNALGEQGGRCLMRAMMEGMVCWLKMTGCTFQSDLSLDYDYSNPEKAYDLDLGDPYGAALLNELTNMAVTKELCGFSHVKHFTEKNKQGQYVKGNSIEMNFEKNRENIVELIGKIQERVRQMRRSSMNDGLREKETLLLKEIKLKLRDEFKKVHSSLPKEGRLSFYFKCDKRLPGPMDCLTDNAIETWIAIIHHAKTEEDRINWLKLVMCDYYVTTTQIQYVLDKLDSMQSDHMKLDRRQVLLRAWMKILDSDKKFAFMSKQLELGDRKGLAKMLGFTRFKLNFLNPTGHWRLDLGDANHKEVWHMILTLEGKERVASKKSSRGDTSQKGNFSNFRNEKLNGAPCDLASMGHEVPPGTLEFDYVSTNRPPKDATPCTEEMFKDWLESLGINDSLQEPPGGVMFQMYLTHAACQHYFSVQQACKLIMNVASGKDQSDAAVAMFARIVDLENFDELLRMREIKPKWKQNIVNRLGWLNIGNPMKPEGAYDLDMMETDQRLMLRVLTNMGAEEPGVHVLDVKKSDLSMQEVYGNSSMLGVPMKKHAKLEYAEVKGELIPNFDIRKKYLNHFLVGEKPMRDGVFTVVTQLNELKKANRVTSGPIKKQYELYLREQERAKKNWSHAGGKVKAMNAFSARTRQKTMYTVKVKDRNGSFHSLNYEVFDDDDGLNDVDEEDEEEGGDEGEEMGRGEGWGGGMSKVTFGAIASAVSPSSSPGTQSRNVRHRVAFQGSGGQ